MINSTTSNPCFVDYASGDYRLRPESPCINAGMTLDGMSQVTDLDGLPRVKNLVVDMGCYESDYWSRYVDSDGDGIRDDLEIEIAGTDPGNAVSVLAMQTVTPSPTGLFVAWSTVYGKSYQPQVAVDIEQGLWSNLTRNVVYEFNEFPEGTETVLDRNATNSASPRIYRVLVLPEE